MPRAAAVSVAARGVGHGSKGASGLDGRAADSARRRGRHPLLEPAAGRAPPAAHGRPGSWAGK